MAIDSVDDLILKDSWGEHSIFTRVEWKREVSQDDTQLGYWDWVRHRLDVLEADMNEIDSWPIDKPLGAEDEEPS